MMDPAVASIIVALIGTIGSLLGVSIKEFKNMKKQNASDHGNVMKKLNEVSQNHGAMMYKMNRVQESVNNMGERLNDHIEWHLDK